MNIELRKILVSEIINKLPLSGDFKEPVIQAILDIENMTTEDIESKEVEIKTAQLAELEEKVSQAQAVIDSVTPQIEEIRNTLKVAPILEQVEPK